MKVDICGIIYVVDTVYRWWDELWHCHRWLTQEEIDARFHLPGGCIAFPELTEQDLCLHHAVRSQPLDGMELVLDYSQDNKFSEWWYRGEPQ